MSRWFRAAAVLGALGLAGIVIPRHLWFRRREFSRSHQLSLLLSQGHPALAVAHFRQGHPRLVVTAHGLMRSMNDQQMAQLVGVLAERYDVLTFDFRGHGRSEGVSALHFGQAAEDLLRVLHYAASLHYEQVAVIGYSMGAAAAIIAAAQGAPVDAVVSVSCPTPPPARGDEPLQLNTRLWRWWAWLMGTRIAPTLRIGQWPHTVIARVSPIPLLIVHDGLDTLVSRSGSERLFAAARPPKDYLHVPWALHAMPMASINAIMDWLDYHLPAGLARTA
ncbi:MAG: alpha/beta hydrolase [Chloroflexi bacterium]|jgi:alpha-beta hydrolase superfamily lysophospholipase|nr:alpha/beta hydrolase [Chloroflexota bacterium]